MSEIQEFYKDKNVFLTGGTGFLGRLIIEKLLRTTEVGCIYLIVRPKKGVSEEDRIKQLFENEIFSKVKDKQFKLKTLSGDLTKLALGLSNEDVKIIKKNVSIILHCGAYLSMMTAIDDSVFSNLRSTREVLSIAKECTGLNALIYVSTAYSHCPKGTIEERFYDPPIQPDLLIKMSEEMDSKMLDTISKGLLGEWPNVYTFTKAVSEKLIKDAGKHMPVGLFRPSVVSSTANEPIKGWTGNLYGCLGIILNINLGIIRCLQGLSSVHTDIVPADMVVNAILCQAWEVNHKWKDSTTKFEPSVLNLSGRTSKIYVTNKTLLTTPRIPMKSTIWYPFIVFISNPMLFTIYSFFVHHLPYFLVDKTSRICGKNAWISKVYERTDRFCTTLRYFMKTDFHIFNDNVTCLYEKLNLIDQENYNFDVRSIVAKDYFSNLAIGLKTFVMKESMDNIKEDVNRLFWLRMIHYITVIIYFLPLFFIFRLYYNMFFV